jgi:hypothetical protein
VIAVLRGAKVHVTVKRVNAQEYKLESWTLPRLGEESKIVVSSLWLVSFANMTIYHNRNASFTEV